MTATQILLAIRHKEATGQLTGEQGLKLLIAWNAIHNRQAAQVAYDDHLRQIAYDALTNAGYATTHRNLDSVAADILNALDLNPVRA